MPEKENFELPNKAPSADIPDLKKKEEERKKSGAAWGSVKPAGSPFAGATAEEGAALGARAAAGIARAAASAARAAGAEAVASAAAGVGAEVGFFAQIGAIVSGMTATLLGKAAFMAAVALVAGVMAAVGYRVLHHGNPSPGMSLPDLGGIASTVKVSRDAGNSGLGYTSQSGLLQSASPAPGLEQNSGETQAGPREVTADKTAEATGSQELPNGAPIDRMAHNLSGAKLSSGLGGQFGGSNISGGGAMGSAKVPQIGAKNGALGQFGQHNATAGKGGTLLAKNIQMGSGMNLKQLSTHASKTLALLRGMASKYNPAIRAGGAKATETNAAAASSQFESSELVGATAPTSPTDSAGSGTSTGGGSTPDPGISSPYTPNIDSSQCDYESGAYWNGSACVTNNNGGTNSTKWQGMVTACQILAPLSAALLAFASAQWTVGIGTMCSGGAILCEEACMIATIVSGILGVAIALMGYMMSQMGAGLVGYYTMGLGTAISATAAWAYMIPGGGSMMGEIIAASMLLIASLASAALPMGKG